MNLSGFQPELREILIAQAKFNAGDIAVVIGLANVTPAPTAAVWSYTVPFELQTATGQIIPYSGNVAASPANTSTAGTAAVGDSTPAVVLGKGEVVFSGDAAAWLDTETATLTVTYTDAYATAHTDTFVVTFSA
jgi:hypothetical protein